jgi:flagellar biosynthetic protein FlhB
VLVWNLQRFAQAKTERATPHRRREARREGRIPRSMDVTAAAALIAGVVGIRLWAPHLWQQWQVLMVQSLSHLATADWTQADVQHWVWVSAKWFVVLTAPVLGAVMFVGGLAAFAQVGPVWLPKQLVPDPRRISPGAGLRRLFSVQMAWQLCRSLFKVGVAGWVGWIVLHQLLSAIANLGTVDLAELPGIAGAWVFRLALWMAAVYTVLAAADYAVERFRHERSLRMSREELREELKRTEGDPLIRSRIRQRGRQLALRRMMEDVRNADVVVTNPTHVAVGLRYDGRQMAAPTVIAKGLGEIALRLRDAAREAGVPVVENPELARTLYRSVDLGAQIPPELYRAVAEVLAYAYRLRGKLPQPQQGREGVTS